MLTVCELENGPFSSLIYLLNMVNFHSYVRLPGGMYIYIKICIYIYIYMDSSII